MKLNCHRTSASVRSEMQLGKEHSSCLHQRRVQQSTKDSTPLLNPWSLPQNHQLLSLGNIFHRESKMLHHLDIHDRPHRSLDRCGALMTQRQ